MADRPLLSLCLICRDEKHNVKRLLDSVWEHVDEVCVADTGSTDGTLAEFKRYAAKRKQPGKLKVTSFEWRDDFAAARQAADDLATGQWLTWADMDDTVEGLDTLRRLCSEADDNVQGYFCLYTYAKDPTGNPISELWRERVVRNQGMKWTGRLHEHKLFTGGTVVKIAPELARWDHHRNHEERTGERNIRILEQWDRDEPDDPRIISSLAMEYMGAERHKDASDLFERFLGMGGEPPDRRAQAYRHMCVMLMLQGRVPEARSAAFRSLEETWGWADTHLTLAEAEQTLGRPDMALIHARHAMEIGKPDTLLIVNPLQYTAHPLALQAVCLAQMERYDEAVQAAEQCLQVAPAYQLAGQYLPMWQGALKRQSTVRAVLALAEVMVETGELVKARSVLGLAPYFVHEDPKLIAGRVELDAKIAERQAGEREASVDGAADAFVKRHLEQEAA